MAALIITNGTNPIGTVQIGKTLYVNDLQLYKDAPMVVGTSHVRGEAYGVPYNVEGLYTNASIIHPGQRCAGYINTGQYGDRISFAGDNYAVFTLEGEIIQSSSEIPISPNGTALDFANYFHGTFSTNIPIFETLQDRDDYLHALTEEDAIIVLKRAVNYQDVENTQDTQDYYIYNTYDTCEITLGIVEYTGGDPTGRYEIIKADKVAGYYTDQENSLEFHIIGTNVVGSVYSSVNQYDVISKQSDPDNWTRGTIYYSGPFYDTLEFLPDGRYTIGVTLYTNIPIFKDEQTALGFLDGTVPEEEAINYNNTGNPTIAQNETGTKELITTFGGNESENVFAHDYMMSRSELATIGGKFFDTNILNALLDGLQLYGNANPMESVLGCLYFPFDLSTVCPDYTAVTDIYFGSYKMENVSANKIKHRSGYKEMGSTFIKPTFYNWLDYKAMHIYLYLAYIGFVELDINKYLNKWLKIIYMVDIHSGECEVSLLADGLLMDTYSGQIGIKQPITYNDLATYFQSQITALRNGVMSVVGGPLAGAGSGAQIGSSGGPYGMLAGAVTGASVGQMVGTANGMWQGWKVSHTKPPLFSKGGYSSEIGANMPQYCFLVFMYNDVEIPENLQLLYGKPSNKSGNVGSFSGFLSTNYAKIQVPTATDEEKNEIASLLNSGIYI